MSHTTPTLSDKFLHVVYEYRYFALAGKAWNQYGPSGSSEAQQAANSLLPGIAVIFQDSLLMHTRLLIDFYTKSSSGNSTDIVLGDFRLPAVSIALKDKLEEYKKPIEVHLLHLTIWRNVDYRTQEMTTTKGQKSQRFDWNIHNPKIIELLFQALNEVSNSQPDWGVPFQQLYDSAKLIIDNTSTDLPTKLLEKPDIMAYLQGLGLN